MFLLAVFGIIWLGIKGSQPIVQIVRMIGAIAIGGSTIVLLARKHGWRGRTACEVKLATLSVIAMLVDALAGMCADADTAQAIAAGAFLIGFALAWWAVIRQK